MKLGERSHAAAPGRSRSTAEKIALGILAAAAVVALTTGATRLSARTTSHMGVKGRSMAMTSAQMLKGRTTTAMRRSAARRAAAGRTSFRSQLAVRVQSLLGVSTSSVATTFSPQGKPDYFGTTPNYANSPFPIWRER